MTLIMANIDPTLTTGCITSVTARKGSINTYELSEQGNEWQEWQDNVRE